MEFAHLLWDFMGIKGHNKELTITADGRQYPMLL